MRPVWVSLCYAMGVFVFVYVCVFVLWLTGLVRGQDPLFPERANSSLVQVVSSDHVIQKVWERGAGLTRACGSGACAAAVAAARNGLTGRKVRVTLPGGDLMIAWRASDDQVRMIGHCLLYTPDAADPHTRV